MKKLETAKTRTVLETADIHRERGKWRQVIVEAHPHHAVFRLKGTRQSVSASWAGIYQHLMLLRADQERAAKVAARRAAKRARTR